MLFFFFLKNIFRGGHELHVVVGVFIPHEDCVCVVLLPFTFMILFIQCSIYKKSKEFVFDDILSLSPCLLFFFFFL